MFAAYYEGQGRIAVRDVEGRPPGPGEVQLKVAFVGICGTDLHILDGDMDARVSLPAILGHEMSGTVTAVGDDVDEWVPGDEVVVVAICGTDLHILDGDMDARVSLPAILGHEMSGTVTAVGDDVDEWVPGDEVVVVPLDWCGTCPACLRGLSHICYRLNFIGIDSPGALQSTDRKS